MTKTRSDTQFTSRSMHAIRIGCSAGIAALLAACGGSGAGDNNDPNPIDNAAAMAIEPLVGVWNLPGNWRGEENDQAYLSIRSPGEDGVAVATVYDFDDASTGLGRECFYVEGLPGTVSQSLSNELFLDVSSFPDAIVSLNAAGQLVIDYIENSASTGERQTISLVAQGIDITEIDITPLCPT